MKVYTINFDGLNVTNIKLIYSPNVELRSRFL